MAKDNSRLKSLVGDEIYDLLRFLSNGTQSCLNHNLVGTYLTGSPTYADFVPTRSDIDLAAVVVRPLSNDELESIRKLHCDVEQKFPTWHHRIECSYIPRDLLSDVLPPKTPRPWWGFGTLYEAAPYGNEWLINLYFLVDCSISLIGPEFKELRSTVHMSDVQKACSRDFYKEWLPKILECEWLANSHYQSYLVLNLCRILYTVSEGKVGSKNTASAWVKTNFPQWKGLIEAAQSWSYGQIMNHTEESIGFIQFSRKQVDKHTWSESASPIFSPHATLENQ